MKSADGVRNLEARRDGAPVERQRCASSNWTTSTAEETVPYRFAVPKPADRRKLPAAMGVRKSSRTMAMLPGA